MFPVPYNDAQRLKSLESYKILDTPTEEAFDHLTRLARAEFGTPFTMLSLVDSTRQWCKSRQGFDAVETPRDMAFCSHTILSDEPLVILDATRDARFRCSPLVCHKPGIRFYAGAPLINREGLRLGSFCVMDTEACAGFPLEEVRELQDFAHFAMQLIEMRRPVEHMSLPTPEREHPAKGTFEPSLVFLTPKDRHWPH
ncbi:GAF domain-containing protein [Denitrobaculum tricleocarpae]|uniref:GAF domain-containing protein n=1 Tax=Denitrobaculum tricleocarpae TaxID=2591009 RepID=A0A545TTX7_9PROT|nr:GAF domain-containing protein [Denitrobaculum tricleocarpae]TQV80621.1 GAF domain-containing protein [Denitrobaculum tricleocarpae]